MASVISAPHFHDEAAAYAFVEARLWANGRVCPHCGVVDRSGALKGKTTRVGLYKCYACRKPFTVKIGTIFEDSHVKMHVWLQAIHLMCSSKKGVSTNQLHRTLGITLKSAWFVGHRLREAMAEGSLNPFGQRGGAVEADETFIWNRRPKKRNERGVQHKMKVLTLIDRDTKRARSRVIKSLDPDELFPIVTKNVSREARLMTDEANWYKPIGRLFADHQSVNHSKEEYVRGDATTNAAEGYFSVFKRGMKGVYQHCAERHLHRYLAEFDFRYNNRESVGVGDIARADRAIIGARGKRLMYRDSLA